MSARIKSSTFRLPDQAREMLRPEPETSVVEWVCQHRYLDEEFAAEPGPVDPLKFPHLYEPHEAITDSNLASIVVLGPSRSTKSEFLYNALAYIQAHRPVPAQVLFPTADDANDEFTGRLKSVFTASPSLTRLTRSGTWATASRLYLKRARIYQGVATAARTLIRKTIGLMLADELDNLEKAAGHLGDTWFLALERLVTFGHAALALGVSTPSYEGMSGWKAYLRSDQRKYHTPCPHCGEYDHWEFEGIEVDDEDASPDEIEMDGLGFYPCRSCGAEIRDRDRWWSVMRGVWVPKGMSVAETLPLDDPDVVRRSALYGPDRWAPALDGDVPRVKHRGYWYWAANGSYWRGFSQIAAQDRRTRSDDEKRKVYLNAWLGRPWKEKTVRVVGEDVWAAKAAAGPVRGRVPDWAKLLVAGADVQEEELYWTIWAFGPHERSALVDYGVINEGNAEAGGWSTWDRLYQICFQTGYAREKDATQYLRAYGLAVDSGWRQEEVYDLAKMPGVVAIKGEQYADTAIRLSKQERTRKKRAKPDEVDLYIVNKSYFFSKIHRLGKLEVDHPSSLLLNQSAGDRFIRHLTAEAPVSKTLASGRRVTVWEQQDSHNHWFDATAYAFAMAYLLDAPLLTAGDAIRGRIKQPEFCAFTPTPNAQKEGENAGVDAESGEVGKGDGSGGGVEAVGTQRRPARRGRRAGRRRVRGGIR